MSYSDDTIRDSFGAMRASSIEIHGGRPVRNDERTCINCRYHSRCWETEPICRMSTSAFILEQIAHWTLRSNWTAEGFSVYMKMIYGGVCGNYANMNPDIHRTNTQNQLKQEATEWEV